MADSNPLGLAGVSSTLDPVTFIVRLAGYVPAGFSILYYGCMFVGLMMVANGFIRQTKTANGRGNHTLTENIIHMLFGGLLAVISYYIGSIGKNLYGEFQDASVLMYVAEGQQNLPRTAFAAMLTLIQFIGAIACVVGLRMLNRISTGAAKPSDTPAGVFWFWFGGLACVFIQYTIGIFSYLMGGKLSGFINSL